MYKTNMADREVGLVVAQKQWEGLEAETGESYGSDYYERFRQHLQTFADKCNPNLAEVVEVLEDAVMSVDPKKRYVPGLNSSFIRGHLLPILPYSLQDFILAKLSLPR